MLKEFFKIKYGFLYILFAFMAFVSFGKGVGIHYEYSFYLVIVSILIISVNRFKVFQGTMKPIFLLGLLTFFASVNYLTFNIQQAPYIQYLSYSISIYLFAIAIYATTLRYPKVLKIIYVLVMIIFMIGVYRYFRSEDARELSGYEQRQNNAFYYVLMPLPFLLLSKNKILKVIALLLAVFICFLSLKRSAIIIITIISLVFIWFNVLKDKGKFWYVLLMLVGVFIGFRVLDKSLLSDRYELIVSRFDKLENDGGSGRVGILQRFFEKDIEDIHRFPEIFIGNGFGAINDKYPDLAALHNDWAEIYYSLGIFGLFVLFWFFVNLFRNAIVIYRTNNNMIVAYASALIIFVFYSFSGGNFFFINTSLTLFAFIGVSEAMLKNKIESI